MARPDGGHEYEPVVLGAVVAGDPEAIVAFKALPRWAFLDVYHRAIAYALEEILQRGEDPEPARVARELTDLGMGEAVGHLGECLRSYIPALDRFRLEAYAEEIWWHARLTASTRWM